MLSKKMAVSLTSLITILALAFVVMPAMAFDVMFEGPTSAFYTPVADTSAGIDPIAVALTIKTGQSVDASLIDGVPATDVTELVSVYAYDKDGVLVAGGAAIGPPGSAATDLGSDALSGAAKEVMLRVQITPKASGATSPTVVRVIVRVSELTTNDPLAVDADGALLKTTMKSYLREITVSPERPVNPSRPQVVSIQRLRPGSQTVVAAFQEAEVTGSFDVRIVISEKPHDFKIDHIEVVNGTKSGFVVGEPFLRRVAGTLDATGTTLTAGAATEVTHALGPQHTILPHPIEGMYEHSGEGGLVGVLQGEQGYVSPTTAADEGGEDNMYHQYRVHITPHRRASEVKISVKTFHDNASPYKNYYQPIGLDSKPNGREQLALKVNIPKHDLEAGYRVYLPHVGNPDFPKEGYYILTRSDTGTPENPGGSFINVSEYETADTPDRENKPKEQTVAQLKYNVRETTATTPANRVRTADEPQFELPNLETFLANEGTIHLVSYVRDGDNPKYKMNDLYISEIMWGTDASQSPVSLSNWIEIHNTGDKIDVGSQLWALWFFEAHETVPTNADYHANGAYEGPTGQAGEIIDIVSTRGSIPDNRRAWSIAGIGQSGRSNVDIARGDQHVLTPTTPLKSMYRMTDAAGEPLDGTLDTGWMQTSGPSVNLAPGRENAIVATPGAAPFDTADSIIDVADADQAKADQAKADADKIAATGTYPMAGDGRVYISEVMFAGGGTLPQWIEISNGDRAKEFNLSGWTLTIANAVADADVSVGATAMFTIPDGTTISPSGQDDTPSTVLVVTETGRNNLTGPMAAGQVINLAVDNEVELILAGVVTRKYTLLSDMAFLITLAPPEPEATKPPTGETAAAKTTRQAMEKKAKAMRQAATDMAGNLGADGAAAWALPMGEDGRSSIIRRHIQVARGPAAPEDGMMANNWILASETSFVQGTHIIASSYYGAANDQGTPGFRAGSALPVELSHFRPARKRDTGEVVITWATESELNNAGFFIKRSQQRNGEFKVINATMVAGAGTTSEKQFYTYTDTTAQPNVVYYYQIEDVSLDGNRQTLTRGIRLKGHVGAAGKLTTSWGELKTSHE